MSRNTETNVFISPGMFIFAVLSPVFSVFGLSFAKLCSALGVWGRERRQGKRRGRQWRMDLTCVHPLQPLCA